MGLFDVFKTRKKEVVYDKQMEILFCFLKNTFTSGDMLDIVEQCNEFKLSAVSRAHDDFVPLAEVHNEIRNADGESNELLWAGGLVFVDANNNKRVSFQNGPNREKCQVIYWRYDSVQFFESTLFKRLISHDHFIAAFAYNEEDHFLQNMTFLELYQKKGMKPLAKRKNHIGQIEVDIDKNPGKRYLTAQTWLESAWRMWFGKNIFNLLDKDKIHRFDKAFSIKELDNSVISVQLYENHEDFAGKNAREIQMNFRNWMEFPKLGAIYPH